MPEMMDCAATARQVPTSVGLIIPTLNAERYLRRLLPIILKARCRPRVLVVDSSSTDGTLDVARTSGVDTLRIDPSKFNHGATRELGRTHLDAGIVVMMTQDVLPTAPEAVDRLIEPLAAGSASISYGRQLPRQGAGFLEAFGRRFSYPRQSCIRSLKDADREGVGAFFCSNAFAAYHNQALDEIGGFPTVLSHEDAIVAAKLLHRGHRIAYVADAVVEHSHPPALWNEFRRHWEAGYSRDAYRHLFEVAAAHEQLGRQFARTLAKALARRPHLAPYAAVWLAAKWTGYKLGQRSRRMPLWLKKKISGQRMYWEYEAGSDG